MDLARAPCRAPLTARKKGSGYENDWHLIGYNEGYCSNNVYIFYHVLWFPVLDLARAPRRAARKKGSGYENATYS